uniref:non-specific serine/threonine protein kinase n=1 Tax=Phallusia mammillata TaxID=59560 RepID=A0A6F9DN54_9ASCI|nr:phosphoinositide 3-kinase regulatory subunit 4 [Phallusia mammillata]
MGNALAATAPSQIQTVESYLADTPEYAFDKSLGSTRFMKVARAKFAEGYTVIKVFVVPDATVNLDYYKSEVEYVTGRLRHASNCLPFQQMYITDRAGLLVRQYIKHNLYDRISTRPFYSNIERRWVAFQLLCALNQMAKFKIWHGDIKSENVLITSWNWLLLSDFATYKPAYLPDDNPADFNYFFDTSRRRTCYIAPERFTDNAQIFATNELQMSERDGNAIHAMDIFSAGCVLAEIFTDGSSLFDLSQLLAFRENKFHPDAILEKIEDLNIRSLVQHMIQVDPSKRYTAEQYLTIWKGKAFPDLFYSYLKYYLGRFCEPPLMSADQIVSALHADLDKIIQNLVVKQGESETLVIVASLLLSCIRKLKYCNCKLKAMHLLVEFAKHLKSDVILERFVPYLMDMLRDGVPRVRAQAIQSLATCLTFVSGVPRGESNIFSEYILPGIGLCAQDSAVPVRQSFAENIAVFAERALRFLDSPQQTQNSTYISPVGGDQPNYDTQLQVLRHTTQNRVQVLLSDIDSTVRQSLLEFSVARLCTFFGKQKANDVLLSHMITFLNDKQDWQLRAAFFRSLVSVASYVGWQSSHFLKPLLQQGLNDMEAFVVSQALTTLTSLTELGLIPKQIMCDLVKENASFLVHPCQWIRQNTVAFLSACAQVLDNIDVQCYVVPKITPLLKYPVLQPNVNSILLSALQPSVKYSVFDYVYHTPNIKSLFSLLQKRQAKRDSDQKPIEDTEDETVMDSNTESVFRKLLLKEMSEHDENMLLCLENLIIKQQKRLGSGNNAISGEWQNEVRSDGSTINIMNLGPSFVRRHADMVRESEAGISINPNKQHTKKASRKKPEQPHDMNEEWKTMFGKDTSRFQTQLQANVSNKKGSSSNLSVSMSQLETAATQVPVSTQEVKQNEIQYKYASCKLDLRALVHHRRDLYKSDVAQRHLEEMADNSSALPTSDWQPKGLLVAHMFEHRGPIHKVAVSPSHDYFVTVSSDRYLRLWDTAKLEGKSIVNRSKASSPKFSSALRCVTFCNNDQIICSADDGLIHSLSVQTMISKSTGEKADSAPMMDGGVQFSYPVNQQTCGRITDLKSIVNSPVVVFLTSYGNIVALDVRTKHPIWELQQDLCHGLPTTFCIDPKQHWLCVGTVRGVHTCWDLRFQLPITKFSHPSLAGVRRICAHPAEPSCIISVVTGNNEVSVWDIETGTRHLTLWASTAPPLSLTQKTTDSVNGLQMCMSGDRCQLYTGGTDCKIRLWDLAQAQNSRIVCGPEYSSSRSQYNVAYDTRLVDGTTVIQEQLSKTRIEENRNETIAPVTSRSTGEQKPVRSGEYAVPIHHHDVITDLAMFHVNQKFLISTSRDGVVKIWK